CWRTSPAARPGCSAGCCRGRGTSRWRPRSTARSAPLRCRRPDVSAGSWVDATETVADAAYRLHDPGAEFAPQVVDVDVERIAGNVLVESVQAVLELLAAQAATIGRHQRRQQTGLAAGQGNRRTRQPGFTGGPVELQRAGLDQVD